MEDARCSLIGCLADAGYYGYLADLATHRASLCCSHIQPPPLCYYFIFTMGGLFCDQIISAENYVVIFWPDNLRTSSAW